MMRNKALITFGVGQHAELLSITRPSFKRYALRHGYDFWVAPCESKGRPPAWGKIPALQSALLDYDEVLWIDADAIILPDAADLAEFVPADAWQALAWFNGIPNTGVWLVRRPMLPILSTVWDATRYIDHCWWEQAALLEQMGYEKIRPRKVQLGQPTDLYHRTHQLAPLWNTPAHATDDQLQQAAIIHATTFAVRASGIERKELLRRFTEESTWALPESS